MRHAHALWPDCVPVIHTSETPAKGQFDVLVLRCLCQLRHHSSREGFLACVLFPWRIQLGSRNTGWYSVLKFWVRSEIVSRGIHRMFIWTGMGILIQLTDITVSLVNLVCDGCVSVNRIPHLWAWCLTYMCGLSCISFTGGVCKYMCMCISIYAWASDVHTHPYIIIYGESDR